jgi:hypothetical protein
LSHPEITSRFTRPATVLAHPAKNKRKLAGEIQERHMKIFGKAQNNLSSEKVAQNYVKFIL